jgi:hypothetical protein
MGKENGNKQDAPPQGIALAAAGRPRRVRYGTFPKPQASVEFPAARRRAVHRARTFGEIAHATVSSPVWQEVMVPALDEIELGRILRPDGRGKRSGPRNGYTAHHFEAAELYRRVVGATNYKAGRIHLTSDRGRHARDLLGFTDERKAPTRGNPDRFSMPGVPSEAAVSKYRAMVTDEARLTAWTAFLVRQRQAYMEQVGPEGRITYLDGTHIRVRGECPVFHNQSGELVNGERRHPISGKKIKSTITVPTGGFIPPWDEGKKGGHGFIAVVLCDEVGVPLAHRVTALPGDERGSGAECLDEYAELLRPHSAQRDLPGVLTADGGFTGYRMRSAARRAGFIENIHNVSHAKKAAERAAEHAGMRWVIDGHPGWYSNGHREVFCECGQMTYSRRMWTDADGVAKVSTHATCATHGLLNLTSGLWRRALNPDGFRLCNPGEYASADLLFGNPLTYNDPMALAYGQDRFGRGEGLNGQLWTGYGLNRDKTRYRSLLEAQLDTTIVFALLVSLAIQYRELAGVPAVQAPLPFASPSALLAA